MPRKTSSSCLGNTLLKDRLHRSSIRIGKGQDDFVFESAEHRAWSVPAGSVTEQSSLDDFLMNAELAGTSFASERNLQLISPTNHLRPASSSSQAGALDPGAQHKDKIRIPRRFPWLFIFRPKWTSSMSAEELHHLEAQSFLCWRRSLAQFQESSSFVLTPYELNIDIWRQLWRVVEKREEWASYFQSKGIEFAFYSANNPEGPAGSSSSDPLSGDQLVRLFDSKRSGNEDVFFVGLVGYPNVGKSSTINSLLSVKRVAVAATPGKTKHFQTLFLRPDLCLVDCPGLVFPNFAHTKAELIVSGVLPVDQMREYTQPCTLVAHRVPRQVLQLVYGIRLPVPDENEDPGRPPTASELLSAYATARGFRTSVQGNPDESRAARHVLKDYAKGKIIYVHPPPLFQGTCDEFNSGGVDTEAFLANPATPAPGPQMAAPVTKKLSESDVSFFNQGGVKMCTKGRSGHAGIFRHLELSTSKKHYKRRS